MGNFSTRIMKNAAETKSISQNSNKIIQKKFKLFKKIIKLFSVCTFKKTLTTTAKLCFLILCKSCSMNFSCLFLHHFMISKNIVKKNGIKKFSTKTLHVIALWRSVLFFYNYISVFQREIKKIIHKVSNF